MIDLEKLRYWAEILEKEIDIHRHNSKDVNALSEYQPLVDSLKRVKDNTLIEPYDMPAAGYWNLETEISRFERLSEAFCAFCILLRGWELPTSDT